MNQGTRNRRNALLERTEPKEGPLLESSTLVGGFIRKNATKPNILQMLAMQESITRFVPKNREATATLRLVKKNIMPPTSPLFSKTVYSAKYAKAEGIPRPKATPEKKIMINNQSGFIFIVIAERKRLVMTPSASQTYMRATLFLRRNEADPSRLDPTIATK
jgi:hypothetical protein